MSRAALRLHTPALTPETLAAPLAAHRVVIIGTPETIAQTRDQLAALNLPQPLGCIVVDRRKEPRDSTNPALPILGTLDDLTTAATKHHLTLAIVTLPMAMADTINAVRAALRHAALEERFVPPMQDLLTQTPPFSIGLGTTALANSTTSRIDVNELLGRPPHEIDRASVARLLTGKRVLITGAGGSIGSEIARICATFNPAEIQLLERAENPLFEIDRQIARHFPKLPRRAVMHDVVEAEATLRLLVELRSDVVFHAAAHKHVPLMEDHPAHAVNNNLFGTKSIADAAVATGCRTFVMVSTDKAVNPTSVMGATKRLAELYVQWLHENAAHTTSTPTRFSMVRFGNVLGSACSVLTIWSAQLAEGGPITVTDPRMTRFFMTIPEAAALVIQAAAFDKPATDPAAVHVLDMGEPVKILDLAQRFVRAHGFAPRVVHNNQASTPSESGLPPIDIQLTGTRPGEKLYEELSYAAEHLSHTPHPGIRAWAGERTLGPACAAMIADMSSVRHNTNRDAVLTSIRRYVPEL